MTFSTRNEPRLGTSQLAMTSLGAVGGPRGAAAGGLRIFVEFLTTYDKQNLERLEGDLRQLDHAANNSSIAEEKRQKRLNEIKRALDRSDAIRKGQLNTQLRADLIKIEALEAEGTKKSRAQATRQREIFNKAARDGLGVTEAELKSLERRGVLEKERASIHRKNIAGEQTQTRLAAQRAAIEGQINKIQVGRATLIPRLAGLAIGAVGGVLGGAVLGIGFQLAQTALEKIGDSLQDIIDPARHAREAVEGLAKSVNDLASSKNISQLQAAQEIVAKFGLGPSAAESLSQTLREIAVYQNLIDVIDQYGKALDVQEHKERLELELRKRITKIILEETKARGDNLVVTSGFGGRAGNVRETIDGIELEVLVTERLNALLPLNTDLALKNAQALEREANAATLAAFAQDKLVGAIQGLISQRQVQAAADIEALGTGESAKTRSLQAALEKAQGGGGSGASAALRNIAEERQLILLRQRLALLGTNINLEKYSGKFLLEAINAKIAALQKEGDAQNRLNSLLDLQYRMSQTIRRQQGESVADFLERRAQEQRQQLQEQADLERQNLISGLEEKQKAIQDQVQLDELAQRRREALQSAGLSNYIKNLQKQLKASKKADAEKLEAEKKRIQVSAKLFEEAAKKAIELASDAEQAKFRAALKGARRIEDLVKLSAAIQGAQAALGFMESFGQVLVSTGALSKSELNDIIAKLKGLVTGYGNREDELAQAATRNRKGSFLGLQKGGILTLNNSSSPFGQNIRFGEAGQEIGVILSNKVAAQLKQNQGPQQIGPFYVNGSPDPLRDKYMLKRTVREAVAEALR